MAQRADAAAHVDRLEKRLRLLKYRRTTEAWTIGDEADAEMFEWLLELARRELHKHLHFPS